MLPATKTPKRKTKSKKQPLGESCNDYCARVAEAYNKKVLAMLTGPSPPSIRAQLRPAMTTADQVQRVIEASLLRQQNTDRQRDAACETAMVERTDCDDAAASQEEEGTASMSALIVSALAHATAYFSVGASASTDLSVSVETVAAPAAAGSSQWKSPTPVCTQRMGTKRKHAGDASVVVTHAQISSEKSKITPRSPYCKSWMRVRCSSISKATRSSRFLCESLTR